MLELHPKGGLGSFLGSGNPSTKTVVRWCFCYNHLTRTHREVFQGGPSLSLNLSPTKPHFSPTPPLSGMATHMETNSSLSLNLSAFDLLQKRYPPSTNISTPSWLAESSHLIITFLPTSKSTTFTFYTPSLATPPKSTTYFPKGDPFLFQHFYLNRTLSTISNLM